MAVIVLRLQGSHDECHFQDLGPSEEGQTVSDLPVPQDIRRVLAGLGAGGVGLCKVLWQNDESAKRTHLDAWEFLSFPCRPPPTQDPYRGTRRRASERSFQFMVLAEVGNLLVCRYLGHE